MTNKDRQEQLDRQRWIKSELAMHDMGGQLDFCEGCEYQSAAIGTPYWMAYPHCNTTYEFRKKECPCAKQYNKRKKIKHETVK